MNTMKQKGKKKFHNKIILYAIDAGAGDCILLHILDENIKILIDSGPSQGEGRINVYSSLSEILSNDNAIDIAIVTHNDDDHIGGYSNLINDKVINVKTFIFNDSSYISKLFYLPDKKYSLKQDKNLKEYISKNNLIIKSFHNKMNNELESFIFKKIKFVFLSPDESKLESYKRQIESLEKKEEAKKKFSDIEGTKLSKDDFERLVKTLKEKDDFVEDLRKENGTSLAFRLEIGNKNFLFLGDSHPSLVCREIKKLDSKKFDLCKLSHHGSDKNTSLELLSKIKCRNYLICSNGKNNHGHPSLKTIARVLISEPKSKFFFSSNSSKIQKIVNSIQINAELAKSGYLKVEYEC